MNLQGRLPDKLAHHNGLAELAITRAIFDSLWSRERSTVNSNRLEGLKYLNELRDYPTRVPFPKVDQWGMSVVCAMLGRSLAVGRNPATIQYEMTRKMRSHCSNYAHICPDGLGSVFMGKDRAGSVVTFSKTNSELFSRFATGAHRRMGDNLKPDKPLTVPILRASFLLLDAKWEAYKNDRDGF